MGTHGKGGNSCSYLRDCYATKRVIWVKIEKYASEANNGEPSQAMVIINIAVLFYNFRRVYVKPKHIQAYLFQKEQN